VAPIGDDVLIARLVEITPAEAINDDGGHNRVILATFTGNLNAPDVNVVDVAELPVERMRVLLLADTADRIVDGLNRAIAVAGTDPDPTPLDGWIDAVRLSAADRLGDLDVTDRRAAADDLFDQLAGQMNITLDRPTLRTMAFTLAAVQALQVVTSPVPPDDPGFAAGVVDVMGRAIDLVVRRYDDAGETHRP
jgi:hypothetical protein